MKKLCLLCLALLLLMMSGCKKADQGEPVTEDETLVVQINVEGPGEITYAEGNDELKFDDEYPVNSAFTRVLPGTEMRLGARAQDDQWMFVKWTKDGQDYSTDTEISVVITASTEFIAVFALSTGYDGPTVSSIDEAKTIGDILALPSLGNSTSRNYHVRVFELNGVTYRAVAQLDEAIANAILELDFDDQYDQKLNELTAPLAISKIDNVTEAIPSQEELDKYAGKTGQDLLDEGWSYNSYNLEQMEFGMDHGWFSYLVKFDGKIENKEDLDVYAAIAPLTIVSVTYEGIGSGVTDPEE